ncbi:MAG: DKNYY domain-containing protein [Pseudomonadota bacterium]|nr:DKNYY domain-containing protein [Pseudomonadota bacterium]
MADIGGIVARLTISEAELNAALKRKQRETANHLQGPGEARQHERRTTPGLPVSRFLAELLHECREPSQNAFIFHFDPARQVLFFAYMPRYDWWQDVNAVLTVLAALSAAGAAPTQAVCMSPHCEDVYAVFDLADGKLAPREGGADEGLVNDYRSEIWRRFDGKLGAFPATEQAIRKRGYYPRSLVSAYKRYLRFVEQQERPGRIKAATREQPYHLGGELFNLLTWDGKVYYPTTGRRAFVELPDADPFTMRAVCGLMADQRHVYAVSRQRGSPIVALKDVDGATFRHLGRAVENVYCIDKNHVYYDLGDGYVDDATSTGLVAGADPASFEYLDFAYGKDGRHVYYRDRALPLDPNAVRLDRHGFIRDDRHVFHYGDRIDMDAPSFQVVAYESETNPFTGTFVLRDKHGRAEYDSCEKRFSRL